MNKVRLEARPATSRFSQWGEENIVRELLKIGPKRPKLIEFGGSRGFDNSNMIVFAQDEIAEVILIEGNTERFKQLEKNTASMDNVHAINAYVGSRSGIDSLSQILSENDIDPEDVFGVSIDIDGDDALIFENMDLNPEFAIVEYNPTLPLDGYFRNPPGKSMGNNLSELRRTGLELGFFEAALTPTNLVLVSNRLADRVEKIDLLDEANKLDNPRFGVGYDGTIVRFSGKSTSTMEIMDAGWSRAVIIQPLPRWLRELAGGPFGRHWGKTVRRIFSVAGALLARPITTVSLIISKRKAP